MRASSSRGPWRNRPVWSSPWIRPTAERAREAFFGQFWATGSSENASSSCLCRVGRYRDLRGASPRRAARARRRGSTHCALSATWERPGGVRPGDPPQSRPQARNRGTRATPGSRPGSLVFLDPPYAGAEDRIFSVSAAIAPLSSRNPGATGLAERRGGRGSTPPPPSLPEAAYGRNVFALSLERREPRRLFCSPTTRRRLRSRHRLAAHIPAFGAAGDPLRRSRTIPAPELRRARSRPGAGRLPEFDLLVIARIQAGDLGERWLVRRRARRIVYDSARCRSGNGKRRPTTRAPNQTVHRGA